MDLIDGLLTTDHAPRRFVGDQPNSAKSIAFIRLCCFNLVVTEWLQTRRDSASTFSNRGVSWILFHRKITSIIPVS